MTSLTAWLHRGLQHLHQKVTIKLEEVVVVVAEVLMQPTNNKAEVWRCIIISHKVYSIIRVDVVKIAM